MPNIVLKGVVPPAARKADQKVSKNRRFLR
jgi:hypothetical protein